MIEYEKIFRTPYSTAPHYEIYDGELTDLRTNLDKYIEREFEWTVRSNKSYFEDSPPAPLALVERAVRILGLEKHLGGHNYSGETLLRRLGVLIQEDIAIIQNGMLVNAYIAFPTNWNPIDKKFKTLAEIHCPVAHSDALVKASSKICDKLANTGKNYHRYAWTITHDGKYSHHPDVVKVPFDLKPYSALSGTFVRIEHQKTFPISENTFGFLINVQVIPMLFLSYNARQNLIISLESMSDEIIDYKNIREHRNMLLYKQSN
jgi:hypothetical protein